jgi:tetratricopeptide (TPR) repeat protein
MKTQTSSRTAFEEVTRALREIEEYNVNKKIEHLERAETALALARQEDEDYLDAVFYSGMVSDLIGRAKDAIPYFERILREIDKREIQTEATFNLGVSYYHRYSHEFLAQAETHFLKVLRETKDSVLRNLTRAHLAQTYAMLMIPNESQKRALDAGETATVYAHINRMFAENQKCVSSVEKALPRKLNRVWTKIVATANNASGMAHMYLADYPTQSETGKAELLQRALERLNAAEKMLPEDWANTSDLGSVHLRLGVLLREQGEDSSPEFQQANEYLEKVVTVLRPNYGFALYELGRLHRVWNRWQEAIEYFNRSLAVPKKYRDVRDSLVQTEKARAESKDSRYP